MRNTKALYELNTPAFGYFIAFTFASFVILIGVLLLMFMVLTYFIEDRVFWKGLWGVLLTILAIISIILLRKKYSWKTVLEITDKEIKLHNPKAKGKVNIIPINKCELGLLKEMHPISAANDFAHYYKYAGPILEIKGNGVSIHIGINTSIFIKKSGRELHWVKPDREIRLTSLDMTYRLPLAKWMKLLKDFELERKVTRKVKPIT